jgi:hypothetical protein
MGGDAVTQQYRRDAAAYCLALLVTALFAAFIVHGTRFHDPLTWDEWFTIESYTWVGVTETGDRRPIRRTNDFEHLPAPSLRNLAIGFYCALGRWPEPNNHVVHSALLNTALLVRRSGAMARTPALIGAALFGLLMFHLSWTVLGWRTGAFAVLVLALGWPYTVDYAASARGYTWGLALQASWLILMLRATRRPFSIATGAAMAAAAIASFANIVSSAVLWVAPAYAAVLFVKPAAESDRREWRRNLTIQILAIGAVGFVFLVDRLPAMFSSAQQYGTRVSSFEESSAGIRAILTYLFPVPIWAGIAGIGAFALIASSLTTGARWLFALALAIAVVDCLYLFQASRLPYARVMFHLIPMVIIGVGQATAVLADRLGRGTAWTGAATAIAALTVVVAAQPTHARYDDRIRELFQRMLLTPVRSGRLTYPIVGPEIDVPALTHQMPDEWLDADAHVPAEIALQLAVFVRRTNDWNLELSSAPGTSPRWYPAAWMLDGDNDSDAGTYRLMLIRGRTHAWPAPSTSGVKRVLFWYPEIDRLQTDTSTAIAPIAAAKLRYFEVQTRRSAKVYLYGALLAVAVITESAEEVASADEAIRAAIAKFGGTATVFIAGEQP